MSALKLAIFDVDGTLVDSQADILASMQAAFDAADLPVPGRAEVLSIVGLSLPQAMARLAPSQDADGLAGMVETYKARYLALRRSAGTEASPLYPGMQEVLDHLTRHDDLLLGIATGKSRRGLEALLDSLNLRRYFVTTQVADDHPSKPHPAMLFAAMREAGADAGQSVMIGDTSYDMEMASAAQIPFLGVSWGYHPPETLTAAHSVVSDASALALAVEDILGLPHLREAT